MFSHPIQKKSTMGEVIYDAVVLGAGFSGAFSAERICRALPIGSKVALIDSHGLLSTNSSSHNECFKMHTGLHYIGDRETAETCLKNSVEMANTFSNFVLNPSEPSAPSRRGRHYLMSNSHSIEYVKEECENLRNLYARLLNEYPDARKVFGEPENFITYLSPDQYNYIADDILFSDNEGSSESISVCLGIETPECQIDIRQFKDYFEKIFIHHKEQLDLLYGNHVVKIAFDPDYIGYNIESRRRCSSSNEWEVNTIKTKSIINCTWQHIDLIDSSLNYHQVERKPCSIRAKAIVEANLPAELTAMNTCIFFSGPHVSLTRIPGFHSHESENRVLITYEPETNIGHFPSGTVPHRIDSERLKNLLGHNPSLSHEDQQRLLSEVGAKILEGAAKYVPALSSSTVLNIAIGFVKMFSDTGKGNNYLYDIDSPIHKRRENGVQERDLCYISFSGIKMTYTFKTAGEVAASLVNHLAVRQKVEDITQCVIGRLEVDFATVSHFRSAVRYSLKCHLLSSLMPYIREHCNTADVSFSAVVNSWSDCLNIDSLVEKYSTEITNHNRVFSAAI